MSELVRFSVSLEADLLAAFDKFVEAGAFATRSEAIRQLLYQTLTRRHFESDDVPVLATLTLVYEHHRTHLVERLLELQHAHAEQVIATMHVHMDAERCLEVIVLRGRGGELRQLAETIRGLKGVHTAELTLAETAVPAASPHRHTRHPRNSHTHPHPHRHDAPRQPETKNPRRKRPQSDS